jgi:ADP-ribose pyrophosphatase
LEEAIQAMAQFRPVKVHRRTRIFDDFFQIDELIVSHMQRDGTMSAEQRRLVFERGDSAAVLILNTDAQRVVLVEQFKAPTLGKGLGGGWITEAVAGMVDRDETAETAAIREAMEETGYRLRELTPIATFFSSPGGTSERICLYYAPVCDTDKIGDGGGIDDEDIEVKSIPVDELFAMLAANRIEDPKLLIAALWLRDELKNPRRTPQA